MATAYMLMDPEAYKHLSMNAGVLASGFDVTTGTPTGLMGVTTGGVTFNSNPTYEDWAADIDQADNNMMEFKRLTSYNPTMSETFLEITPESIRKLNAAADIDSTDAAHVVPRSQLTTDDFRDVWWIGDYSDVNTGESAGFLAIHLKRALNTAGFQITSGKNAKNQCAFEYHGHYTIAAQGDVPFEIWCKAGTASEPAYTYTAVSDPSGDPSASGWYERSGMEGSYTYTLSADTTVDSGKTYYTRDA